jgi:hypothetical protein
MVVRVLVHGSNAMHMALLPKDRSLPATRSTRSTHSIAALLGALFCASDSSMELDPNCTTCFISLSLVCCISRPTSRSSLSILSDIGAGQGVQSFTSMQARGRSRGVIYTVGTALQYNTLYHYIASSAKVYCAALHGKRANY